MRKCSEIVLFLEEFYIILTVHGWNIFDQISVSFPLNNWTNFFLDRYPREEKDIIKVSKASRLWTHHRLTTFLFTLLAREKKKNETTAVA